MLSKNVLAVPQLKTIDIKIMFCIFFDDIVILASYVFKGC